MHLFYVRIICLVIVFLISAFFFCLPILVNKFLSRRERRLELLTNILNCIASGVFFGTLTLNVWPSAITEFKEVLEARSIEIEYPLACLLIACGFFLIVIIEDICHYASKFFFNKKFPQKFINLI